MTRKERIKIILREYKEYMNQMTDEEIEDEFCRYFGITHRELRKLE